MAIKNTKGIFSWLFAIYSFFVLYGSIVPLQYHPLSFTDAISFFFSIKFLPLKECSRMDLATNILLGMPTSFLAMSACFNQASRFKQVIILFFILFYSLLLATAAEFLQIFFSFRDPSVNDISAQAIGSLTGILIWFLLGPSLINSVAEFISTRLFDKKVNFFFSIYLIFLIVYSVMPLDITLNPIDLYHKWREGRINVVPFVFKPVSVSTLIYDTMIDIIQWSPIAFFLVYFKSVRVWAAICVTTGIAFFVEISQLFVFSRITDIADVITAFIGGSIGAILPMLTKGYIRIDSDKEKNRPRILGVPMILFAFWVTTVIVINWHPFDFTFAKNMIKHQLNGLSLIPFSYYQHNDFYNAITSALRKTVSFMPGGFILSFVIKDGRMYSKTVNKFISLLFLVLIVGCAGLIEAGQVFLPGKVPDLTDIILETIGAAVGFASLNQLYRIQKKLAR